MLLRHTFLVYLDALISCLMVDGQLTVRKCDMSVENRLTSDSSLDSMTGRAAETSHRKWAVT